MDGKTLRRAMSWSSASEAVEASARARTLVSAAAAMKFPNFFCMVFQITVSAPWLPLCLTGCRDAAEKPKRSVDAQAEALDGFGCEAPRFVARSGLARFDQHRVHLNIAGGNFEARGQAIQEFFDNAHAIHADHTVVRPGHANVGDVRSAFGQYM